MLSNKASNAAIAKVSERIKQLEAAEQDLKRTCSRVHELAVQNKLMLTALSRPLMSLPKQPNE